MPPTNPAVAANRPVLLPEWDLVNTGLFGAKSSFVPLAHAFQSDNGVLVPYDKQLVKDAPRIDPDQHLSETEERQLWRHYGLDYDTSDREVRKEQIEVHDQDEKLGRHERRRRR